MQIVAIIGGTGFIGGHLVELLAARERCEIRIMVRNDRPFPKVQTDNLVTITGGLTDPDSLKKLLTEGCTLVNLAHLSALSRAENLAVMEILLGVCAVKQVRRVIHCSTAVVAGNVRDDVVTEATECRPAGSYETAKLAVERLILETHNRGFEATVLRPTAVFGPGGMNLLKLAQDLLRRSTVVNYAKSCLQGRRRMNLVHVDNVTAALTFLIDAPRDVDGEAYIVSDDESPLNNYRDVERHLARGLGIPYYPVPPVAMPRAALSIALRLLGRSNTNPDRIYDGSKLMRAGLKKPMQFEQGLTAFASWYRSSAGAKSGEAP